MLTFDKLCRGLTVEVANFAICEVSRDATFILPADSETAVHYVLTGTGHALLATGEIKDLVPHTILIVPPGVQLAIVVETERPIRLVEPHCVVLPNGWDLLRVGDGAPELSLACGQAHLRYMEVSNLFAYLREPLIVNVAHDATIREPFRNLLEELADPQPGTAVLADMLMKQCLIALLRQQAEATGGYFVPWLAAHADPALGGVIGAMLDRPEASHSLESLGDIAGMSRAVFAQKFKDTFGRTAMDSLREIRLRRAADLLCASELPVKTVAARVGYESRSHFSRAFKAHYGIDPAGFRANPTLHLFRSQPAV